jgi:pyrimidine-nucleoside phosphorylase
VEVDQKALVYIRGPTPYFNYAKLIQVVKSLWQNSFISDGEITLQTVQTSTPRMIDLIGAKRSGQEHSRQEINFIVDGVMTGSIPDYQLASWLMAVCFQGMTMEETAALTNAMANSGQILDLSVLGKLVGDKHSTGGVGDKTTLVFVPLLRACGIPMAKLSGRGLGHSGGTIDKLEAIPGFVTELSTQRFVEQLKAIGMAVGSQTQDLAPCDGKIYALRDVTGTVDSIPLIAASVMSKKIAAGANLIILDVKCGQGAFMKTEEEAKALAATMTEVGRVLGKPVICVVTEMEQPLGNAVGHTTEVIEAIETLKGNGPSDLKELCLELGSQALLAANIAKTRNEALNKLEEVIKTGKALATLAQLIEAQDGDARVLEDYSLMPQAKIKEELILDQAFLNACNEKGKANQYWIEHLDGLKVAQALKLIGAGRAKKGDAIDLAVGLVLKAKVGDSLKLGDSLATIHCQNLEQLALVKAKLAKAYTFATQAVPAPTLIKAVLV